MKDIDWLVWGVMVLILLIATEMVSCTWHADNLAHGYYTKDCPIEHK